MTTKAATNKDIQKLQRAIVDGLEDVKAQDIQVFDTEHLSPLFERVIVASGSSNRQTKALAASVRDALRDAGFKKPRIEGEANGEWIIVDCGAAVVHIMQPAIRRYYQLEEIWGEKPIRTKLGAAKPAVPLASEEQPAPAKKATTSLRRSSAAKSAIRSAEQAAKLAQGKPAAKKSAAKKTLAKKIPAGQTAAAKTAAKSPVKTVVVKQAPAKKAAAKKASPAAKKAARKTSKPQP